MKILLLQDVKKIGRKGEIKNVSDGFALNNILPKKLGLIATPDIVKKFEHDQKIREAEEKIQKELTEKTFHDLASKPVIMKANASDKGHLFASIHVGEILAELKSSHNIVLSPTSVELKHPIKEIGEYKLKIHAHGVDGVLNVEVK
jgi:large subunit ribosomal protein L9